MQCNCQFERTITLDGTAVWVNATIRNDRTDHTDYGRYPQELPAACTAVRFAAVRIGPHRRRVCGQIPLDSSPAWCVCSCVMYCGFPLTAQLWNTVLQTCYNGTKPWTNAPLQNWDHPGFGPWSTYAVRRASWLLRNGLHCNLTIVHPRSPWAHFMHRALGCIHRPLNFVYDGGIPAR